jgi:hypothetical protein
MDVETRYRAQIEAMTAVERVRRAEELFQWSRDYLARSIAVANPGMSDDDLKWEVARRQYGTDPATSALIDELRHRAAR